MKRFNKATAGVVGGAIGTMLVALLPELGAEAHAAIPTLIDSAITVGFAVIAVIAGPKNAE